MEKLNITVKAFSKVISLTITSQELKEAKLQSKEKELLWKSISQRKSDTYSLINQWTSLILENKSAEIFNLFLNILNNKSPRERNILIEYFFIYLETYQKNKEILNLFDSLALRYLKTIS